MAFIQLMLDFQPQRGVGADGAPFKQVVFLEHVADAGKPSCDRLSVEKDRAFLRLDEAAEQGKKRGFPAAGGPHNGDEFSGTDRKGYIGKGPGFSLLGMVGVAKAFYFQLGNHRIPRKHTGFILEYVRTARV